MCSYEWLISPHLRQLRQNIILTLTIRIWKKKCLHITSDMTNLMFTLSFSRSLSTHLTPIHQLLSLKILFTLDTRARCKRFTLILFQKCVILLSVTAKLSILPHTWISYFGSRHFLSLFYRLAISTHLYITTSYCQTCLYRQNMYT